MFCPSGISGTTQNNSPVNLSLAGVSRNNRVLYVSSNPAASLVSVSFDGQPSFSTYAKEGYFAIPAAATGVTVSVGGSGGIATVAVGEDV